MEIIMLWAAFIFTTIVMVDMFTGRHIAEFIVCNIVVRQSAKMMAECGQLIDRYSIFDMKIHTLGPDIDWTENDNALVNALAKIFAYADILTMIHRSHKLFDEGIFITPRRIMKSEYGLSLTDITHMRMAFATRLVYSHKMGVYDINEITHGQIKVDSNNVVYADNIDDIMDIVYEIGDLYERWHQKSQKATVETP